MAPALVCRSCGGTYDPGPDEPWRCACGHPLDFAEPSLPDEPPATIDRSRGLWAFEDLVVPDVRVSLGEGWTPLVDAPRWNATVKLEYLFPSGSFKDRGATTVLSRARSLGVERVVEDSSGNAGAAIATYAARAGIQADIYVPASAAASKIAAIERVGATPIPVEGDRGEVTNACQAAVERGDVWYASHVWNPAFLSGTKTFAFELAAQRDWSAPDAVVLPIGHGTLFLGAYRGFAALADAGWIDEMPRLLGVQASGVAPIAAVYHGERAGETNDAADGIQIAEPPRRDQLVAAIDATDGDAIALGQAETEVALEALHHRGFYVEPTSAVAVAGLEAYRERGVLSDDADVVVPLTGSGLKY